MTTQRCRGGLTYRKCPALIARPFRHPHLPPQHRLSRQPETHLNMLSDMIHTPNYRDVRSNLQAWENSKYTRNLATRFSRAEPIGSSVMGSVGTFRILRFGNIQASEQVFNRRTDSAAFPRPAQAHNAGIASVCPRHTRAAWRTCSDNLTMQPIA